MRSESMQMAFRHERSFSYEKGLTHGLLALRIIAGLGCATKTYVWKQTEPLNTTESTETATTQNSGQIKDLDARTQQSEKA